MVVEYTPNITDPVFQGLTSDGGPVAPGHNRMQFQIQLMMPIPDVTEDLQEHIKARAPLTQWMSMIETALSNNAKTYATVEVGYSMNIMNQALPGTTPQEAVPVSGELPDAILYVSIQRVLAEMAAGTV